ncbi:MAG: nuclease A inhibitor family protein [Bacteroidota bacterium]|nr:nuclease A inhibitor family protein [Bacteroidota bacterium]
MNDSLKKINEATTGLQYISESDFPFEPVYLSKPTTSLPEELVRLAGQPPTALVAIVTLEQFFRPMTTNYAETTPEQKQTALRFRELQRLLQEKLANLQVYKIGRVRAEVFIIGRLNDGSYGGLKTIVIET